MDLGGLRAFPAGIVRVRLTDGSEYVGRLRTELLSEQSIAVFLYREGAEGATIYLDQIAGVWPAEETAG